MERFDLEGFIYSCSKDVEKIYCPLLGEIFIDENTKMVTKMARPAVGKWCRFSAHRKQDEGWYAGRVELLAFPRLKYVLKDNECIIEGRAVVCNIDGKSGYLWNDHIGFISVEGEEARLLSPLTAVEFQAVPFRKKDSAAFFMVKEITVGSECVYNSDVLLFARNAEVKENGIVHVSDCTITLLKEACSIRPLPSTTISVLYYTQYNDATSGVGIYATADSNIVAGISEDYFTTERSYGADFETVEEDEIFCDASEDVGVKLSQSLPKENEVPVDTIDASSEPSQSTVEFVEFDDGCHNLREVYSLAFESSAVSAGSQTLDFHSVGNEATPAGAALSDSVRSQETNGMPCTLCRDVDLSSSSKNSTSNMSNEASLNSNRNEKATCVINEAESDISFLSQEELWDKEFIEHLKMKMKALRKSRNKEDVKCSSVSRPVDDCKLDAKTGEEMLQEEMKSVRVLLEERLAFMRRVQSVGAEEADGNNGFGEKFHADQCVGDVDLELSRSPEDVIIPTKEECDSSWSDEMDQLFAEVLKNPRLRNFVCVNRKGAVVLRDITKYLEYQMTSAEVSEQLGIPLSEVTLDCFDIVYQEKAVEIYTRLIEMDGFEYMTDFRIPTPPNYAKIRTKACQ